MSATVVVAGAGVAGLAAAWELSRAGANVTFAKTSVRAIAISNEGSLAIKPVASFNTLSFPVIGRRAW